METKIKIPSLIFFKDKQNKKNNFDKLSCSSLNQALIEARSIISNTPHPCQNKFCQQYHNAPSLHNNNNGNNITVRVEKEETKHDKGYYHKSNISIPNISRQPTIIENARDFLEEERKHCQVERYERKYIMKKEFELTKTGQFGMMEKKEKSSTKNLTPLLHIERGAISRLENFIEESKNSKYTSSMNIISYKSNLIDNAEDYKKLLMFSFDKLNSKSTMKKIKLTIRRIKSRKLFFDRRFLDMIILWKLILKIKPIQLMERLAIPNLHRLASSNIIIDKEEVEKNSYECCICYANAGSYRMSEHCKKMGHFYCGDCVQQYVHTTIHNGKYPAHCPACASEKKHNKTKNDEKKGKDEKDNNADDDGIIEETTLASLVASKIITEKTKYRFILGEHIATKKQLEYFPCPNKRCDKYLYHGKKKLLQKGRIIEGKFSHLGKHCRSVKHWERYQPGLCPCGQFVCMNCKTKLNIHTAKHHKCIVKTEKNEVDEATLKLLEETGKVCPNCELIVQKNGGCDVVMCGTNAHGRILDALKAGGCGCQFNWSTLRICGSYFYGYDGKRVEFKGNQLQNGEYKKYLRAAQRFFIMGESEEQEGI